jgi:O-antigen/teichoic acid export membrane protein
VTIAPDLVEPRSRLRGFVTSMWGRDGKLSAAAVGTVGTSLGGTALRFITQAILARWLGAAAYGQFVVGRGWGELLAKVPNRGYQMTSVRFLPRYEAEKEWSLFRGLLFLSRTETLLLGLALSAVSIAAYTTITGESDPAMVAGLALAPALAMVTTSRSLLQGVHLYVPATALTELVQPVIFAAAIGALVLFGTVSASTALWIYVATMVVIATLEGIMLRRALPEPAQHAPRRFDRRRWVETARPMFVAQLAIATLGLADVLIVGAVLGPVDAGLYAVATRIAVVGRVVNSGLESVVAPRFADAWSRRDVDAIQKTIDRAIRTSVAPTVGFVVITSVLATPVLSIFGEQFVDARVVLMILLAGNVANAFTGPSGYVVALTDSERVYAAVMAVHAVALVILCWVLAHIGGITAVALVQSGVTTSWNLCMVVLARRRLGMKCYPRRDTFRLRRRND